MQKTGGATMTAGQEEAKRILNAEELSKLGRSPSAGPSTSATPSSNNGGTIYVAVLSEAELRANVTKTVAPNYPPASTTNGSVRAQVVVSENGDVIEAEVTGGDGDSLMRKAALDAVKQWRFRPISRSGVAVRAQGTLTLNFTK